MGGSPSEALDDAVELKAAVEAAGEAGEVRRRVLRAEVVVGAGDCGLDVAGGRVDPPERGPARRPLARACDDRAVRAAGLRDRRPAGQAVAEHGGAGCHVPLGELLDLLLAEALDHRELEPFRPPVKRSEERRVGKESRSRWSPY